MKTLKDLLTEQFSYITYSNINYHNCVIHYIPSSNLSYKGGPKAPTSSYKNIFKFKIGFSNISWR